MSFDAIIAASWSEGERMALEHEAITGSLAGRIEEARRGYREAMESTGITLDVAAFPAINPWEDLYVEWEDGAEYAHDEDDDD